MAFCSDDKEALNYLSDPKFSVDSMHLSLDGTRYQSCKTYKGKQYWVSERRTIGYPESKNGMHS
jgi:hypothetical protein